MKNFIFFFMLSTSAFAAADNQIQIEQVGNNNTFTIYQESTGNTVDITLGTLSSADNNAISIDQYGMSLKNASIDIISGYNNTINVLQQGIGNHTAAITNLNGASNNITIQQSGSGNHSMNIVAAQSTINNNNSIIAIQSGRAGADKIFNLNLNGATGAIVNIQQTSNFTDSGSMTIQCLSGSCGSFSYIRQ